MVTRNEIIQFEAFGFVSLRGLLRPDELETITSEFDIGMELPKNLKIGEVARLIPVVADSSKEQRAASTFLAVLSVVPDFANVQLVVLDVLGKEVSVLVREPQDEGEYSVTFDGTDLPSGVYFYRIEIGHASATRSMMLVK